MKCIIRMNPIKKYLLMITSILVLLLLVFEFLFSGYFYRYTARASRSNMDFVLGQITTEFKDAFDQMNNVIDTVANSTAIQDYVSTECTKERYRKISEYAIPIVQTSTANLNYDHVLILDISNNWYRYIGSLSRASRLELTHRFKDISNDVNAVIKLDGVYYLCTVKPIIIIKNHGVIRAGTIAALSNVEKLLSAIDDYGDINSVSVYLYNHDTVLQYSNKELKEITPEKFETRLIKEYSLSKPGITDELTMTISIPQNEVFPQSSAFIAAIIFVLLFSFLIVLTGSMIIQKWVIKPMSHVIGEVSNMGTNYTNRNITQTGIAYVDVLVTSINTMLENIKDYSHRAFNTQQALYEAELSKQKAQLYLLCKQIDTHFLYNSLGSIKTLADMGETEKIVEISQGIALLLRYVNAGDDEVNLFDEFEMVQRYINIANIRFGEKIKAHFDVDDRLCEYKVIKLLVQPLVENAIIHGIEHLNSDGNLYVRGYLRDSGIYIEVEDDGIGIPYEQLISIQQNLRNVSLDYTQPIPGLKGIAILNIQKRIWITFGQEYGITLDSVEGKFTKAILFLPAVPFCDFGILSQLAAAKSLQND